MRRRNDERDVPRIDPEKVREAVNDAVVKLESEVDRAVVLTMYETGCRPAEVSSITYRPAIGYGRPELHVPHVKPGRKTYERFYNPSSDLLDLLDSIGERYPFEEFTSRRIQALFTRVFDPVNGSSVTPLVLRRAATEQLIQDIDACAEEWREETVKRLSQDLEKNDTNLERVQTVEERVQALRQEAKRRHLEPAEKFALGHSPLIDVSMHTLEFLEDVGWRIEFPDDT